MPPIHPIRVTGSPFEVGQFIGRNFRDQVREQFSRVRKEGYPIKGDKLRSAILSATQLTAEHYPNVVEEIEGIADGADLTLWDLMYSLYEDLDDLEETGKFTGCTDIIAQARGSEGGETILGHNNDSSKPVPLPVPLIIASPGKPEVFGVHLNATGISAGCNSAGLILTGNSLHTKEIQVGGIPRILLVRAILDCETIEQAAQVSADPTRASTYNNIVADSAGRVLDMEGSAKRMVGFVPNAGIFAHSNHYLAPALLPLESSSYMENTTTRLHRAMELLRENYGRHNRQTFMNILGDHKYLPDSICDHEDEYETSFSIIFEAESGQVWLALGSPCRTEFRPVALWR